jgi:hypothetical protein
MRGRKREEGRRGEGRRGEKEEGGEEAKSGGETRAYLNLFVQKGTFHTHTYILYFLTGLNERSERKREK